MEEAISHSLHYTVNLSWQKKELRGILVKALLIISSVNNYDSTSSKKVIFGDLFVVWLNIAHTRSKKQSVIDADVALKKYSILLHDKCINNT